MCKRIGVDSESLGVLPRTLYEYGFFSSIEESTDMLTVGIVNLSTVRTIIANRLKIEGLSLGLDKSCIVKMIQDLLCVSERQSYNYYDNNVLTRKNIRDRNIRNRSIINKIHEKGEERRASGQ